MADKYPTPCASDEEHRDDSRSEFEVVDSEQPSESASLTSAADLTSQGKATAKPVTPQLGSMGHYLLPEEKIIDEESSSSSEGEIDEDKIDHQPKICDYPDRRVAPYFRKVYERLSLQFESDEERRSMVAMSDYVIAGLLGSGTFGRVYLAHHYPTLKAVALKLVSFQRLSYNPKLDTHLANVFGASLQELEELDEFEPEKLDPIHPDRWPDPLETNIATQIARLRFEVAILQSLEGFSHFIATLYKKKNFLIDFQHGELGFAMNLELGTLHHLWKKFETLTPRDGLNIPRMAIQTLIFSAAQIVDALCFLHQVKIVHRHVSPHNILVGSDGFVKLSDFGRSVLLDGFPRLQECLPNDLTLANYVNNHTFYPNGAPEEIWNLRLLDNYGKTPASQRIKYPDLVPVGPGYDLFLFGKTLLELDWPYRGRPLKIQCDLTQPTMEGFLESFCIADEPRYFSQVRVLMDFIQSLMRPNYKERLGLRDPEEMFHHPLFKKVKWPLIRSKEYKLPFRNIEDELLPAQNQVLFLDHVNCDPVGKRRALL